MDCADLARLFAEWLSEKKAAGQRTVDARISYTFLFRRKAPADNKHATRRAATHQPAALFGEEPHMHPAKTRTLAQPYKPNKWRMRQRE